MFVVNMIASEIASRLREHKSPPVLTRVKNLVAFRVDEEICRDHDVDQSLAPEIGHVTSVTAGEERGGRGRPVATTTNN